MRLTALLPCLAALLALGALPAAAQTIRSGMSLNEVRETLGEPARVREVGGWSYLFYPNGCPNTCGSDDVVFLQDGRVVSAVFRTARRRYAGPPAAGALASAPEALDGRAVRVEGDERPPAQPGRSLPRREAAPAEVEGIRIQIPGSEEVSVGGGTIIRPGDRARGIRTDTVVVTDTLLLVEESMTPRQRRREGLVTPRTVPEQAPSEVRPDTAMDRTRREREERVVPRTIPVPRPTPR